jgi:hypothetical protein
VNVLGYTINPDEHFNLLKELKNINNNKKADASILVDGKAITVIELKGTETTDIGKIEIQAFKILSFILQLLREFPKNQIFF